MKQFLLVVLFSIYSMSAAFAQSNVVKGSIKDTEEQPVIAAIVSLTKDDSTIISYAVTNNDGAFEIRTSYMGEAMLHTSHISYVDKQLAITLPTTESLNIVLENDASEIGEVVVLGEKPITSITDEGNIRFNVSQIKGNLGSDITNVLNKLPGVTASQKQGLTLNGQQATLYIDGRKQSLSGAQAISLLKAMPVENVDNVELNSFTSSSYDATTEKARNAIIAAANDGIIRVMFGSTETFGTGVNAQQRCVAIHHLDTPWTPSALKQRDGRAIRTGNRVAKLYANNKVDVILYAVERSLDAYKFGLLHNKQLFIRQLKTNNMGCRTIDEGVMDEKSGTNMAEYVAILSGKTELLEKARLEKKVTALESEWQVFIRSKSSSRYKLERIEQDIAHRDDIIRRISKDLEAFKARVEYNDDGSYRNTLRLNDIDTADMKLIGKQLNHISQTARTGGYSEPIGSIYGFDVVVKSEDTMKDGFEMVQNRFYVRGEGNYLYQYNYGNITSDPRLDAMNPINALATIEPTLERQQREREVLLADIPTLRQVIDSTWRKEDELNELKTQLKELDRQIQQSLKPITEDKEGEEITRNNTDTSHSIDVSPYIMQDANTTNRLQPIERITSDRIIIGSVSPPSKGIKI